jgi:hypothetical protein
VISFFFSTMDKKVSVQIQRQDRAPAFVFSGRLLKEDRKTAENG